MLNYASRWSAVGCTNSTTKKWLDTAGLLMEVADNPPVGPGKHHGVTREQ